MARGWIRPGSQEEEVGRLVIAGAVVVLVPGLPFGNWLIYPFVILTTWFHEMGHGLTALLMGYDFERLVLLADGSGFAQSSYRGKASAWSRALISAGGPLGPSIVGSLLILASSRRKYWRPTLFTLAGIMAISTLIWVRSPVGFIVIPALAGGIVLLGLKARDAFVRFGLQFLGVLAALSMFRDWDYLFSESAVIGGQVLLSDTGAIEEALFLPHWVWAILIILASGLMIGASLKYALAHKPTNARWPGSVR